MKAPVLSILNMKGGVGKTTVSAHVIRVLYQRWNKRVLLIDLDAQFNLTQSVIRQERYDIILAEGNTVLSAFEPAPSDDFFKVKNSDQPPRLANDVSTTLRKVGDGTQARLDLIAGAFNLMKYSMIDDPAQLRLAGKNFSRFISMARDNYDLIVLDCNPSSSFVTKCALENSSHVLSPVRPDKFSIQGVGMVDQLFSHLGVTVKHMILFNGIKRSAPRSGVEKELRSHVKFGPKALFNRLATSSKLAAEPTYTGFATDIGGPYSAVLKDEIGKISDEIAAQLGFLK